MEGSWVPRLGIHITHGSRVTQGSLTHTRVKVYQNPIFVRTYMNNNNIATIRFYSHLKPFDGRLWRLRCRQITKITLETALTINLMITLVTTLCSASLLLIWLIRSASTLAPYSFDQIQSLIVGQYTRPQSPVLFHFELHDWQLNLGRFHVWWTISLVTPNTARSSLFFICSKHTPLLLGLGRLMSSKRFQTSFVQFVIRVMYRSHFASFMSLAWVALCTCASASKIPGQSRIWTKEIFMFMTHTVQ